KDRWSRMAEGVAAPGADDRDPRGERAQELWRARGEAPVMRDLEDPQRRWPEVMSDPQFDLAADVAGEHDGDIAPPELEHDGIVVANPLPFPIGTPRMLHRDPHIVQKNGVVFLDVRPAEPPIACGEVQRGERLERRNRDALPDVERSEFAD